MEDDGGADDEGEATTVGTAIGMATGAGASTMEPRPPSIIAHRGRVRRGSAAASDREGDARMADADVDDGGGTTADATARATGAGTNTTEPQAPSGNAARRSGGRRATAAAAGANDSEGDSRMASGADDGGNTRVDATARVTGTGTRTTEPNPPSGATHRRVTTSPGEAAAGASGANADVQAAGPPKPRRRHGSSHGHKCACGNSWCTRDADPGHAVPSRKKLRDSDAFDTSKAQTWLERVGDRSNSQKESLAKNVERIAMGSSLQISRAHFFPCDIVQVAYCRWLIWIMVKDAPSSQPLSDVYHHMPFSPAEC